MRHQCVAINPRTSSNQATQQNSEDVLIYYNTSVQISFLIALSMYMHGMIQCPRDSVMLQRVKSSNQQQQSHTHAQHDLCQ